MINLLIVDDEIFTLEGLVDILPLKTLGITNTKQAFDGVNALEIVKDFKPDILLTDVKMPRMNGIDLAFEIRKLYPDCSIIFMSGYSDKEYLKSAIQLKAITYVEKPIELEELEIAIKNAILENSKSKTINYNIEDTLALEMTKPWDISRIEDILSSCVSKTMSNLIYESSFLTILVPINISITDNKILSELRNVCRLYNFNCFISKKGDNLIIIQLFFSKNNATSNFSNSVFTSLFDSFGEHLSNYTDYFICVGKIVHSINEIYDSFMSANEVTNYTFFYNYNSVIFPSSNNTDDYSIGSDFSSKFNGYLLKEDKYNLILFIKQLTLEFNKYRSTPISSVKDTYYKLILLVSNFANTRNISFTKHTNHGDIFELILECPNIFVLEKLFIDFIEEIFAALEDTSKKSAPVVAVLDYIHQNYSSPSLCLEEISKNTFLTPTYICVIFKEHTSKTVNKYITEYRTEKAKSFLKDTNIKMSDVAEKVGYNDPNYFSKIFRKATNYTPSEYRRLFTR